jgi:ABC-2 type transport system permease protein
MRNIFLIAKREFLATVKTKAFVIGLLILPALIGLFALIGPKLFNFRDFKVQGEIAVIDPTGHVVPELKKAFDKGRNSIRLQEQAAKALAQAPQQIRQAAGNTNAARAMAKALGPVVDIHILERPLDSNIEREKTWLYTQSKSMPRLALIAIHPDAVTPIEGNKYGSYDLYIPPNIDNRSSGEIQRGLRDAIVSARFQAQDIDHAVVDAIVNVAPVTSMTVSQEKQHQTVEGFNEVLPAIFGFLLLMAVMGGGGQLLTTMVEEKSNRVVEVLLSAVSPMELMTGKLLGQMAVSLVGMIVYLAMGIAALAGFALLGLFDFSLIFYLLLFFVITYMMMGSIMMAVGAAVNDMKEAQGLMAPLSIMFMIPWFLWMPISRDPNSVLSIVMSFTPFVNSFAMLLRMATNTPPPFWQVWLSIGMGIVSTYGAVWFAAKIFRIGILMYGKPPNLATLIRWAKSA